MRTPAAFLLLIATITSATAADGPIRFWNLTLHTISDFRLAPVGTTKWSDKDGTVDSDERLRITGIEPGVYDASLKDTTGRACLVRNIKIEAGAIFSIEEKDLTSCEK
jgi:hypothetical protein